MPEARSGASPEASGERGDASNATEPAGRGEREAPRARELLTADPETLAGWRRNVLDRVSVGVFFAGVAMALVDMHEAWLTGDFRFLPPMGLALFGLFVVAFIKRIPFPVRATLFVLTLAVAATWNLFGSAFYAPNTFVVAAVVTVLIGVSVGHWAGWWTLAVFALGLSSAGVYFVVYAEAPKSDIFDATSAGNWFRVVVSFVIATSMGLISVAYLTRKLEGALEQAARLLRALRQESDRRLSALRKQQALEAQLRQAEELEALGRLAGGVAHDFNNLLVVIINHAAILRKRLPDSVHEELRAIEHAGTRAAALTRQLLTYGRHHEEDVGDLDVNETLTSSLSLVRRLLPSTVELVFCPDADVGLIRASRVDIEQLILNLCINARDAMPDGGSLVVSTEQAMAPASRESLSQISPMVLIKVKDTGRGIQGQDQERIFEPFFTTKESGRGTGLGLSVVERVVKKAGGSIGLDSQPGGGTEFRVYLPCSGPARSHSDSTAMTAAASGGDETILVVDDLSEVREMAAQILREAGYTTVVCENGNEARAYVETHPGRVNLVVTDVVMPKMTGKELYDALGADKCALPFVFCTGYSSDVLPPGFFERPGRVLITKPYRAEELLRAVRGLLDAGDSAPCSRGRRTVLAARGGP